MNEEEKKLKKEAYKEAFKEALSEFLEKELDKKFQKLGEWVAHTISVLMVGAVAWFILHSLGWSKQ